MLWQRIKEQKGFTLVELMVVLVILGIVGSFAVPALTGYIDDSKEKKAVTETQACVTAATGAAAEERAEAVNAAFTENSDSFTTEFTKWAGTLTGSPIAVTGDLTLTEGDGQYYLKPVYDSGKSYFTKFSTIINKADVTGSIDLLQFNADGKVLCLVYTSADGITVAYSAGGSAGSPDTTIPVATIPAPTTTPIPTLAPTPTTAPKDLIIILHKVDADRPSVRIGNAEFTLYKDGVFYAKVETNTSADVTFTIKDAGTYTLKETVVPEGYQKAADVTFTVTLKKNGKDFACDRDRKITIEEKPVKKTYTIWAVDEDGNRLSDVPLYLTGDGLGSRKDSDVNWVSDAASGKEFELRPWNKEYTIHIKEDTGAAAGYDVPCTYTFYVKDDFTLEGGSGNDRGGGWVNDNNVYIICKKIKSTDGVIIGSKNGKTLVSLLDAEPWPYDSLHKNEDGFLRFTDSDGNDTLSASIEQGKLYYTINKDGEREYFFGKQSQTENLWAGITDSAETIYDSWNFSPWKRGYAATPVKLYPVDTKIITLNDTTHFYNDNKSISNISSGNFVLYNGELYIFTNTSTEPTNASYPPVEGSGNWYKVNPEHYKVISYEKGADTEGEKNHKYDDFLNN